MPPISWFMSSIALDGTDDYYKRYLAEVVYNRNNARKRRETTVDPNGRFNVTIGSTATCNSQSDPEKPCNGKLQPGQKYRYVLRNIKL